METPDRLQERQEKNKEVRRSKIVLYTVAIGAVIAMMAIRVNKILDSTEKSFQKPAAAAPEKTDEGKNQPRKPVQQDLVISKDASPESLIEDEEFIGDCKPGSLQDACDILREADVNSVQCDIYTAVNQAFAFFHEEKTLEDSPYNDIGDVFEECGLNEEEQKKVLREGIQQGDTNIGAFVREKWISRKCNDIYQKSSDYEKNENRYNTERKACDEIPADITAEDLEKIDDTACIVVQEEAQKRCEENAYPSICKIKTYNDYWNCFNALLPGLSYEVVKKTQGTRLYCSTKARREYEERDTQWIKQCYRNLSEEFGVEWKDVEYLYKAHQAEDFMRRATERSGCDGVSGYISALYWLDVESPDVLEILGVKNQDDIVSQYIEGEVEECVLTQYDRAFGFCDTVASSYTRCSWRGRELWEYGGTYSKMEDIKKGKYPMAGSECINSDTYCY